MSKTTFYVGIDVGRDELWACCDDHKPRCFKHTKTGIRSLYNWAEKAAGDSCLHICMEATGVYGLSVAYQLHAHRNVDISIINPAQIASYARAQLRRTKTDQVDARVILSFAQSQQPSLWSPESKSLQQLCQLVTQADAIQADLRQWTNRRHAQQYSPNLADEVKKSQRAIERTLKRQLEKIHKSIENLCQNDVELNEQTQLLKTITGVGHLTAVRVLAYGKKALIERNRKQLTAHAGLAPRHRQSGTSVHGKSYIAKQGDRRLRAALYMPTLVAIVHNPVIKSFYQRLLEKGKPKMLAIIACMRKLLLIIRAMLINKKTFNPELIPLT